jgi:hypothetical protein
MYVVNATTANTSSVSFSSTQASYAVTFTFPVVAQEPPDDGYQMADVGIRPWQ